MLRIKKDFQIDLDLGFMLFNRFEDKEICIEKVFGGYCVAIYERLGDNEYNLLEDKKEFSALKLEDIQNEVEKYATSLYTKYCKD